MVDFSETEIGNVSVHWVGNKLKDEGIKLSAQGALINEEDTSNHVFRYFFGAFSFNEFFNLTHVSDLNLNEVYTFAKAIFEHPESHYQNSVEIAKHLYEKSDHPKILGGELWVCYFKNCYIDGEQTNAIGIYKSEVKDAFLKIDSNLETINHDLGISITKPDKACLIFNVESENGYKVCTLDSNRGQDANYWKYEFLNLKSAADNYHFTKDFLSITKAYVTQNLSEDFEVGRTDQIDLLNRSVEYFKKHDNFEKENFEQEVFQDENLIQSFRSFDEIYREDHDIQINDSFEISNEAVKKQVKNFKSVLKLDKNFHIYIHGNKDYIEQGVEQDGRKFYKIYYKEEH